MAVGYRFNARTVSRAKGGNAVHKAAYITGERLNDNKDGKAYDYSDRREQEVLFTAHYAPKNAPDWARDIEQAWNKVEEFETRKNSTVAREFIASFPHQIDEQRREFMLKDFLRDFMRQDFMATGAIHAPDPNGDERNFHAHIMLFERTLDENGFNPEKDRRFTSHETRTEELFNLKDKWADLGARQLEKAGLTLEAERWRYGHLTLPEQFTKAIERNDFDYAEECIKDPSKHRGAELTAMEREGVEISPLRGNPAERERLDNLHDLQRATLSLARERYELERAAERQNEPEKTPEPERNDERLSFEEFINRLEGKEAERQKESGSEYNLANNINELLKLSPAEFVAGLQASSLHLARATADDCKAILEDTFKPDGLNLAALKIKEGDLCAVTNSGKLFALPSWEIDKEKVSAAWIAGHEIERADMQTISEVRQEAAEARQERAEAREQQEINWQNIREERADQIERDIISAETRTDDRDAANSLDNVGGEIADGIGGVANVVAKIADKSLTLATETIANIFGATPAPKELLHDIADRKQWAREDAAERQKLAEQSERSAEAGKNSQDEKQREEWRDFEERTRRTGGYDRDRER